MYPNTFKAKLGKVEMSSVPQIMNTYPVASSA